MTREIKFRAWDEYTDQIVYPCNIVDTAMIIDRYDTVMQFTGLKDKNGVDIYEGDILKANGSMIFSNPYITDGIIRAVKMLNSGFTLVSNYGFEMPNIISNISNYTFWNTHRDWTVIGNIHQNPELINEDN